MNTLRRNFFFFYCVKNLGWAVKNGLTDIFYLLLQQGVQKLSTIVIIGSFLNTKFAVKRLDKNKHFQKDFFLIEWAVKNGLKDIFYLLFGKNWTKSPRQKRYAGRTTANFSLV